MDSVKESGFQTWPWFLQGFVDEEVEILVLFSFAPFTIFVIRRLLNICIMYYCVCNFLFLEKEKS